VRTAVSLARDNRNRSRRRDDALRRLLAAAEALIDEGASFSSIKVEELAARAEISRAGFYIHFQDKVELLEDWLTGARADLFDACNRWYAASPALERQELHAALEGIVRAYRERMTLMLAAQEAAQYDAVLRDEFDQAFEVHVKALANHIRAGRRSGDIVGGAAPRDLAEWLTCMLERVPMQIPRDASERQLKRHVAAAAHLVWAALYAPARPA
jgi:AcrR family transcriptional regulator